MEFQLNQLTSKLPLFNPFTKNSLQSTQLETSLQHSNQLINRLEELELP